MAFRIGSLSVFFSRGERFAWDLARREDIEG
jgi:hypothetical protein